MELENIFKKMKIDNFKNNFFEMFSKKRMFLLSFLFLSVLVYSGYLWYTSIYNYSWDENKKQEYIKSKSNEENSFNKARFEKNISEIEKRKAEYLKPLETPRDIFGLE
jgi:uncharacterized membrane protein